MVKSELSPTISLIYRPTTVHADSYRGATVFCFTAQLLKPPPTAPAGPSPRPAVATDPHDAVVLRSPHSYHRLNEEASAAGSHGIDQSINRFSQLADRPTHTEPARQLISHYIE